MKITDLVISLYEKSIKNLLKMDHMALTIKLTDYFVNNESLIRFKMKINNSMGFIVLVFSVAYDNVIKLSETYKNKNEREPEYRAILFKFRFRLTQI